MLTMFSSSTPRMPPALSMACTACVLDTSWQLSVQPARSKSPIEAAVAAAICASSYSTMSVALPGASAVGSSLLLMQMLPNASKIASTSACSTSAKMLVTMTQFTISTSTGAGGGGADAACATGIPPARTPSAARRLLTALALAGKGVGNVGMLGAGAAAGVPWLLCGRPTFIFLPASSRPSIAIAASEAPALSNSKKQNPLDLPVAASICISDLVTVPKVPNSAIRSASLML
mmetsp:Transcript_29984/g.66347  ORF Transcript_29984/g.66347 Transcript_29984/m.66347 type:complete len:233 (-) Transcript_29984:586-1284(-)